jgi:hypothetical protein
MRNVSVADPAQTVRVRVWISLSGIALAVAFALGVGLLRGQLGVIAVAKRLRRAKLDFFESQNLEIGFSQFGPTVALIGTVRTLHKDYFVRAISVTVTRKRDSIRRSFDWSTFRSAIDVQIKS